MTCQEALDIGNRWAYPLEYSMERCLSRYNLTKKNNLNNLMKKSHKYKNRCFLIDTDIDIFILHSFVALTTTKRY